MPILGRLGARRPLARASAGPLPASGFRLLAGEVRAGEIGNRLVREVDLEVRSWSTVLTRPRRSASTTKSLNFLKPTLRSSNEPSCMIICCFTWPRTRVLSPFFSASTARTSSL